MTESVTSLLEEEDSAVLPFMRVTSSRLKFKKWAPFFVAAIALYAILVAYNVITISDWTPKNFDSLFESCMPTSTFFVPSGTEVFDGLIALSYRSDVLSPRYIVLPKSLQDVIKTIQCARFAKLKVFARSGGHSLLANSERNSVLIDMSRLNQVFIHPDTGIATIGAGATMGELLWNSHKAGRWLPAGVCPGVGVSGFLMGGGHSMYEGKLGLACDSVLRVTMVNRFGQVLRVSKTENSNLFWALCGSGGGHFGIITSFTMRTVSSVPYDNSVVFRYSWPHGKSGELLKKWTHFNENLGETRVRKELFLGSRHENKTTEHTIVSLGACFNVTSPEECENRLMGSKFFHVPGRKRLLLKKVKNALELHSFLGPDGNFGRKIASNIFHASLETRYVQAGEANGQTFHSAYLSGYPSEKFWQSYAELCSKPNLISIPWVVCELRLVQNSVRTTKNNAFPHRDKNLLLYYVIGGGSSRHRTEAYKRMNRHLKPYIKGVYVNYADEYLENYPQMYWGRSLCRLQKLKYEYDPGKFFSNPQPIPKMETNHAC